MPDNFILNAAPKPLLDSVLFVRCDDELREALGEYLVRNRLTKRGGISKAVRRILWAAIEADRVAKENR